MDIGLQGMLFVEEYLGPVCCTRRHAASACTISIKKDRTAEIENILELSKNSI